MAESEVKLSLSPAGTGLRERISTRESKVAVIGAGYVGLPLAVRLATVGFTVICVDQDSQRVAAINAGRSYIRDVRDAELADHAAAGRLRAQQSYDDLRQADVIIGCLPTPVTKNKEPDISGIQQAAVSIAAQLRPGQLVSLESTTYPGTVEEVLLPAFSATGLQVGVDYFLCHSPERVDPGNPHLTIANTAKVVGGVTPACLELAGLFYEQITPQVVRVSSPRVAELTKLFENTYRAVNIALVNELAMLCDRMGLDVWEVLDAATTKGYGIQPFWPGPGVGGHCIALDPYFLAWKAREYDFSPRFIELATDINLRMPHYVKERLVRALSEDGKPLRGAGILVVGVAYKRDVPDLRESPSLKIIQLLVAEGARVSYHDPHIPEIRPHLGFANPLHAVPLSDDLWPSVDAALILTDHTSVDYAEICRRAPLVLDARNATRAVQGATARIIKL